MIRLSTTRSLAVAALAAAVGLTALTGCEPQRNELNVPVSDRVVGDRGTQAKDLVQMTDIMAADMVQIPEIVRNPNKITVVMTGVTNKTESEPLRDQTIYTARIRALLNQHARDRLAFIENRANLDRIRAAEGPTAPADPTEDASRYPGAAPRDPRIIAQYTLKGEFYDKVEHKTTYRLFTFQLVNIATGEMVWEHMYEIRTLNY